MMVYLTFTKHELKHLITDVRDGISTIEWGIRGSI
jgi:hypothetical protein